LQHGKISTDVLVIIKEAPGSVSITSDTWTVDTTKAAFLGVTAHWIEIREGRWMVRAEVVGFQSISGDHSGENLGRYIVGIFDRVGIMRKDQSKVHEQTPSTSNGFLNSGQLLTAMLDNASSNTALCTTVEDIHLQRKLPHWWADKKQLP